MSEQLMGMSSVRLGLAVAWPAFWTGIPFKVVIALLFLAMGLHPWEGTGLAFLLLLSIPIDIWALGLTARTVFLEGLRAEPSPGLGLTLWWQVALMSAIYLPLGYLIQGGAVSGAKAVTHKIMGLIEDWPIAEKISIELVLWGSAATAMLILVILGWLFLFGRIVRRQATASSASAETYQALIRRWDLMRVPADQPLLLTAFIGVGIFLVLGFWGFLPVTTPHPHEDYEVPVKVEKPFKPDEALDKVEQAILQAEMALGELEQKKSGQSSKAKRKNKTSRKGAQQAGAAPMKPGMEHGAESGHQH